MLAVARFPWECEPWLAGPARVETHRGAVACAADAAIYYRQDLAPSLGIAPGPAALHAPSELLAAGLAQDGIPWLRAVEGDYALIGWHGEQKTGWLARDFAGSRPLHYALVGDSLVAASRAGGVLEFPGVTRELNVIVVAEIAASLFPGTGETAWQHVREVPAGHAIAWRPGRGLQQTEVWPVPEFLSEERPSVPFRDAREQLRLLLRQAAAERMRGGGTVSAHLSGGWDSTAVVAAASEALGARVREDLVAVSVDFPPGDAGHESHFVAATHQVLGFKLRLLDGTAAPFLENGLGFPNPDDPFAHVFAGFNRALARECAASGARVAMTGWGGDQLFAVGLGYLADLFRNLRMVDAWREFRSFGGRSLRHFVGAAAVPALPDPLRVALARMVGASTARIMERPIPSWVAADFAKRAGLVERQNRHMQELRGRTLSNFETRALVAHAYFPRVYAELCAIHLGAGVEVRSPLFDRRIVAFAATRPRRERVGRGETKGLLRGAFRDLLPDLVLAPRPVRTGTLDTYLGQAVAQSAAVLERLLPVRHLVGLGVADPSVFRSFSEDAMARPAPGRGVELVHALQVECWLGACCGTE